MYLDSLAVSNFLLKAMISYELQPLLVALPSQRFGLSFLVSSTPLNWTTYDMIYEMMVIIII